MRYALVFLFVLEACACTTDLLYMMTGAKHAHAKQTSRTRIASNALWRGVWGRAVSLYGCKTCAREACAGARGSNPSQKTPRQRSARSALSTPFARSAKGVASYSKAHGLPCARGVHPQADSQHCREFEFVCLCSPALFKRRASQRQTRALSTRVARSLLFKSARLASRKLIFNTIRRDCFLLI